MTACNLRPPQGHPFHGTLVACHLTAGHKDAGIPHSWEIPETADDLARAYHGPWIATFQDPPLDDHRHDRIFAVGPVWHRITLVKMPGPHGWTIVAGDGIPDFHTPRVPWDGEVTYRLTNVVPLAGVDGEPVAYYTVE